jgi:Icc protein
MDGFGREIHTIQVSDDVVRVVQLTDTHLCHNRGGTLLGMDTDHSLQAVIDCAMRERERIDMVLGTGDLADGGARGAYERLLDYFSSISNEHYWLPGNHDDRPAMESVAQRSGRLGRGLRTGRWLILMLDSQVPGEVGGELGPGELGALELGLELARKESLYVLVCLHHQPVKVGCEWLDEQMVADADKFFAIVDRFPGVRGVLWGHVHQEIDWDHGGIRLLASPSTCVQFAPGSAGFRADDKPPGYRWLDLHVDGRIETGISRVTDVAFTVDLESGGYL